MILKEKALKFAKGLGELEFKASYFCLHNWKKSSIPFCQILLNLNLNRFTCTSILFFCVIQVKIQFFCSYFRNVISFKTISSKSTSLKNNMTAPWNETTLPILLSNYKLEKILNADEFGLFYLCFPKKIYYLS